MDKKKDRNKTTISDDELLEYEYEQLEKTDKRRPKRLRSKEEKSKKSDSKLAPGKVIECFTNNYYRVKAGEEEYICPLSGRFKNVDFASSRSIVVVGDHVKVDLSSEPRIEEIEERKNVLRRYILTHRRKETEVILAANIDQVVVTASYREPQLNLNLVDRYLCSAELSGILPVVCITKIDLMSNRSGEHTQAKQKLHHKLDYYRNCGYEVLLVSALTGERINSLKKILKDKNSVFSGKSGTGKTTIINKLNPSLNLKTASVSSTTKKGKHTTSSSVMISWSFGGHLIDTPGIRTFGLPRDARDVLPRIFPGFRRWAQKCKFSDCKHKVEAGCRILQALKEKELPEDRYKSYLNLLAEY